MPPVRPVNSRTTCCRCAWTPTPTARPSFCWACVKRRLTPSSFCACRRMLKAAWPPSWPRVPPWPIRSSVTKRSGAMCARPSPPTDPTSLRSSRRLPAGRWLCLRGRKASSPRLPVRHCPLPNRWPACRRFQTSWKSTYRKKSATAPAKCWCAYSMACCSSWSLKRARTPALRLWRGMKKRRTSCPRWCSV